MNNKTLIVYIGNKCNNNCIICSVHKNKRLERNTDEIINDIKQGRKKGFSSIEFTGGEPSIRKDVLELINLSRELGYKTIGISTNGRMFSYENFCKEIIQAGLNKITISLLGSKQEVHDAITRTPVSFVELSAGIKNLKNKNITINISTNVNKINLNDLVELSNLIKNFGIDNWNLLDLVKTGSAEKFLDVLDYDYDEFIQEVSKIDINKFKNICFFDFPKEIFNSNFDKNNIKVISKNKRDDFATQIGL